MKTETSVDEENQFDWNIYCECVDCSSVHLKGEYPNASKARDAMTREDLIERAKAFTPIESQTYLAAHNILDTPNGTVAVTEIAKLMADFAIEQINAQALQFNDARSAMKEAYQQGVADGKVEAKVDQHDDPVQLAQS